MQQMAVVVCAKIIIMIQLIMKIINDSSSLLDSRRTACAALSSALFPYLIILF